MFTLTWEEMKTVADALDAYKDCCAVAMKDSDPDDPEQKDVYEDARKGYEDADKIWGKLIETLQEGN